MSFNRLNYDTCAYKQNLYQSVGPGEYRLTEPPNADELCFSQSPQVRLQKTGVSVDPHKHLIDIDSELLNLPNFFATPHIGGISEEGIEAMGMAAIEGLDDNVIPSY